MARLQIISHQTHYFDPSFRLTFTDKTNPKTEFQFPCDRAGNPLNETTSEQAELIEKCKADPNLVFSIEDVSVAHVKPTIGMCNCSGLVRLAGYTNPCLCGRTYGPHGELLSHDELDGLMFEF